MHKEEGSGLRRVQEGHFQAFRTIATLQQEIITCFFHLKEFLTCQTLKSVQETKDTVQDCLTGSRDLLCSAI
jgi:hypothetical protein